MRPSEMLKALEDGKRISNTKWPEEHYWEMKLDGSIKSVGDGIISFPKYKLTDLYQIKGNWIIVPKYVNFSEAMKAVEEGKNATCYFNDEVITIVSYNNKINSICKNNACSSGGGASILIAWIVAGKWAVEDVSE
jgi:hypothetical protein